MSLKVGDYVKLVANVTGDEFIGLEMGAEYQVAHVWGASDGEYNIELLGFSEFCREDELEFVREGVVDIEQLD